MTDKAFEFAIKIAHAKLERQPETAGADTLWLLDNEDRIRKLLEKPNGI